MQENLLNIFLIDSEQNFIVKSLFVLNKLSLNKLQAVFQNEIIAITLITVEYNKCCFKISYSVHLPLIPMHSIINIITVVVANIFSSNLFVLQ